MLGFLGAVVLANGTLLSLAGNAATGDTTWPGVLDLLRTNAWWAVLALTLAAVVVWLLFTRLERAPAVEGDPPPPPAPDVEGWLVRRAELRQAIDAVLARSGTTVGLTTSLHGAGGFGKTRLARMVAADRRIRRRFRNRVYLVTIGRDLRSAAEITAKVGEVTRLITGDDTPFSNPETAGDHLARLLAQRPRTLLVLDDVWEQEQLEPFLRGAPSCVRLVTTRRRHLLNGRPGSRLVLVDGMTEPEARTVLLEGLDSADLPGDAVAELLSRTGRWPLLLRLVNRLVMAERDLGVPVVDALRAAARRLRDAGPATADVAGMDAAVPAQRERAVEATIEAAVDRLPAGGRDRLLELGVFAEDEAVPLSLVRGLWQASAGLTTEQAHDLIRALDGLALVAAAPAAGGRITLHDVLRDYLRLSLGAGGLARSNAHLVNAIAAHLPAASPLAPGVPSPRHAWWDACEGYVLDHAVEHLVAADRAVEAEALASDLRWIDRRLHQRGPNAAIADLRHVGSPDAVERSDDLTRAAHVLQRTHPDHALTAVLHSRLHDLPRWTAQVDAHADQSTRPRLSNLWPLPDQPQPTLRRTLTGHTADVKTVVISPDGTWLATAGYDETVRIWDPVTGTQTAVLIGHSAWVLAVAISPDGTWLATAGYDRTVRIWDPVTGMQTAELSDISTRVLSVAISPDGTWLATGSADRTVRIWDLATLTQTAVLTGHTDLIEAVAVSPDGTWLASAGTSTDRTARIWDVATGTQTAVLTGHTHSVHSVAISPDGTWLATTSTDRTVRIWDPVTGTQTAELTGDTHGVSSAAISPDGTWLAVASHDQSVQIWDPTSTHSTTLFHHTHSVNSVAISPDGTWLATGSNDRTARIWSATGTTPINRRNHVDHVNAVAIAPDGTWLATAGRDTTVRIWDAVTGTQTTALTGHSDVVRAVAISPDGTWLATGSDDRTVRIWDPATGTSLGELDQFNGVSSVTISSDGSWLAAAAHSEVVRIWECGDEISDTPTCALFGRGHRVSTVAISPDGSWVATGSDDNAVWIWDRSAGFIEAPTRRLLGHDGEVTTAAVSPNGTWLATGSQDTTVRIWNPASGTQTAVLTGHTDSVTAARFSPGGTWLATTSNDRSVRIWHTTTWEPVAMMRTDTALTSCGWSPDSSSIAVGGENGLFHFRFHPGTSHS
ncbi:NB-ARC domain-containing protein [Kitasatospora sp. NPDC048365]|uniref:NB-ARC domain-containing protein n=1 Tax=Kitasatospora sp. NPDC048365 TaxID=3364050 RepID=UPI003719D9E0